MWLSKIADGLYTLSRPITGLLHKLGAILLAAMMFLTAADVLMRYVFNRPIMGAFDITEYLMGMLVASTMAYCALKKRLVKVDLLSQRLPERMQSIIDSVTSLLGLGLFLLITWQAFVYIAVQYNTHVTSLVLHIPRYPFIGLMALGFVCFVLILLANVFENLSKAVKR